MTELKGKVVTVTGAGSGIGRALAHALVARGAHVAISDVDEARLNETRASLPTTTRVTAHVVDVRDRTAVERYADAVRAEHGGADAIINNAGVAARATIEDCSYDDFAFVIDVNLWGVVHGVKAFLPLLRARPEGHIVNISSINGMVPFAKNGPYNISKYGVLALSETLMQELRGQSIHVTCVHPGGIKTNIARSARHMDADEAALFDTIARTTPAQAAEVILDAVEGDRERVHVGVDSKLMAAAKRLFPSLTVDVVGRVSNAPPRLRWPFR